MSWPSATPCLSGPHQHHPHRSRARLPQTLTGWRLETGYPTGIRAFTDWKRVIGFARDRGRQVVDLRYATHLGAIEKLTEEKGEES